jgi:hypothetical protein
MVVIAMMIRLIDVKFDSTDLSNMREYMRVRGSKYLYTLLFVNSRQWNTSNVKTIYEPSSGDIFYLVSIEFEVTANALLMLQIEGKYKIEEVINA